eukprot:SAG22_NODE_495_length_9802_cov_111.077605_2_plen_82_part_00
MISKRDRGNIQSKQKVHHAGKINAAVSESRSPSKQQSYTFVESALWPQQACELTAQKQYDAKTVDGKRADACSICDETSPK